MRINKFIALATGMSRRAADTAIEQGRVAVDGAPATAGSCIDPRQTVTLDGQSVTAQQHMTIALNKPAGYVVSRDGQGSKTIYNLLPTEYHHLKPIGRLDKESSGLLILTNDGQLAHDLTHPSKQKLKTYEITLDVPLQPLHRQMIHDIGIGLDDGISQLNVERVADADDYHWIVRMKEGRNRQIRRTFAALGYTVTELHRTHFGPYTLNNLREGLFQEIT